MFAVSIAKVLIISTFSLLGSLQESEVNAEQLSPPDETCSKSEVRFDTSSLKYIFLHTEEILSNPKAFWESDNAYKNVARMYSYMKREIPYEDWTQRIIEAAKSTKEERKANQYYLLAGEIEEQAEFFNSNAIPLVCSYLPTTSEPDISFVVYFTAYTGSYRFMYENNLIIDVTHERWNGSSKKMLNNLVRVAFDEGYRKCRDFRTEEPLDNKLYSLLGYLQLQGISTYVGHQALDQFPAENIQDYSLFENPSEVTLLRNKLNDLFLKADTMSENDLRKSSVKIGIRGHAYPAVGAHMAKTIEGKLGRATLIDTIAKGPRSFVQTYNSVAEEDEKIFEFDIEKNR